MVLVTRPVDLTSDSEPKIPGWLDHLPHQLADQTPDQESISPYIESLLLVPQVCAQLLHVQRPGKGKRST